MDSNRFWFIPNSEQILWSGKPHKVLYILPSISQILLSLLWLTLGVGFVFTIVVSGQFYKFSIQLRIGLVGFFLIWLFPVWITIIGPIIRSIEYKNVLYVVTGQRVYATSGLFGVNYKIFELSGIVDPLVSVSPLQKLLYVGTIELITESSRSQDISMVHIQDPYAVFNLIKESALSFSSTPLSES